MTILLIELETSGHHITSYLRSIVTALNKKGEKIIFLTSKEIKSKDYYSFFKKKTKLVFTKKIKYPSQKNYLNLIKFQFNYYKNIKIAFEKIRKDNKIDYIYINTLDFFDKPLSLIGSPFNEINFSGLYLNPKFYNTFSIFSFDLYKTKIYKFLFGRLLKLRNLDKIFFVDPLCFEFLKKNVKNLNKVNYIEELGTGNTKNKFNLNKNKCRNVLDLNHKDFIILVYGKITTNKCLDRLFDVFEFLKNKEKIKILIAGEQDLVVKKYINEKLLRNKFLKKKVKIINNYINDKMEKIIFKASDLTWVGYSKKFYGSSGVYFLSCINKTPVLTSDHGVIGWYGKRYNVGSKVDLNNNYKLIKIIDKLTKNKKINYDFNVVNKKHNLYNFGTKIISKIIL